MTMSSSSVGARGSASGASAGQGAAAKRTRASYRRELTAPRPGGPGIGAEAQRAAALILEVLAGVRSPTSAASALGIRLPRYYLLEQRAVQGLILACAPRPRGRTVSADRRLARLERELAHSQRELARHQALARTTQRVLGLAPPVTVGASSKRSSKAEVPGGTAKRRRRKPSVRALKAARLLGGAGLPGPEAAVAVQQGAGGPGAPGAVGGGSRPAVTAEARSPAQADHGGLQHAGRPKAVEHR